MSGEIRKRFCLRCSRLIQPDDVGAVELQRAAGAICGVDVDKMIAEIYVERDPVYMPPPPSRRFHHSFRLPGEFRE